MLKIINDTVLKAYIGTTNKLVELKNNEQGVTAVEYAIVVAGVAAICTVVFGKTGTVATMINGIFSNVSTKVAAFTS